MASALRNASSWRASEATARQLVDRAEDLLTLGQLEHGSLVLTRERIDLREVVDCVVRDFAEAQVELALPKAPLLVTGDARRLADALRNLVLDAVKYTLPRRGSASPCVEPSGASCSR